MDPEYTQIAARGEPLTERVANGHTGTLSEPSEETRDVLQSFRGVGTAGTWDGRRLSGEALAAHVAFEEWPADEPLPEWIDDLQELIDTLSPTTDVPEWASNAPFAAVLCQYVDHAWASFAAAYPTARLTDAGEQSLREILLERLVDVLAQAHHVDFVRFVAEREPELIREDRLSAASTEWHDRYVRAVGRERAAGFFEEYAVAARLLVDTVRQWEDRLGAFCERLHDDWDAATGLVDGAPSAVTGVAAVGDRHAGNDCVLRVETDDGVVLYKPRSLAPERELYGLERDLAAAFETVPELATPALVAREGYGWVAEVTQESHDSLASVADYYERAGALLAISYVLHTTDCHCGNVIAARESPVVIDPETVFEMTSRAATGTAPDRRETIRTRVIDWSVLGTGLVPQDAMPRDTAGFTGISERESGAETLQWLHVGTDAIDIEYVPAVAEPRENFPVYEGEPVGPAQFEAELVDGFERTYDALRAAETELSSPPTERFDGIETRIIVRATKAYDALRNAVWSPTNLRHGARYDLEIRRTLSLRDDDPVLRRETKFVDLAVDRWDSVVEAEHRAVRRGDVPKFATRTDDPGLYFDGERVLDELTELTGVGRLRRRLDRLDPDHRRRQVGLVRAALRSPDVVALPHPDGDV
jgi:type 2 lantibiotic biosynthesis protein LanM